MRHNLSLNKIFINIKSSEVRANTKGGLWALNYSYAASIVNCTSALPNRFLQSKIGHRDLSVYPCYNTESYQSSIKKFMIPSIRLSMPVIVNPGVYEHRILYNSYPYINHRKMGYCNDLIKYKI